MSEHENNNNESTPEKTLEELRNEKRLELIGKLEERDWSFKYAYGVNETPYEVLETVYQSIQKYAVPFLKAKDALNDWLEANKEESDIFTEEVSELVEALSDPLGVEVEVREKVELRIVATIEYIRKPWEKDDKVRGELLENLDVSIKESYSDYLYDYTIDEQEER